MVQRLAELSFSRKKLAQEQKSLILVRSSLSINYSFQGLFRGLIAAPRMERLSIGYTSSFSPKSYSLLGDRQRYRENTAASSEAEKELEHQESINKRLTKVNKVKPETLPYTTSSNIKSHPDSAKINQAPFPYVGLLLQNAIMNAIGKQHSNPIGDINASVQTGPESSNISTRIWRSSQIVGVLRDAMTTSATLAPSDKAFHAIALARTSVNLNRISRRISTKNRSDTITASKSEDDSIIELSRTSIRNKEIRGIKNARPAGFPNEKESTTKNKPGTLHNRKLKSNNQRSETGPQIQEDVGSEVMQLPRIIGTIITNLPSWKYMQTGSNVMSRIPQVSYDVHTVKIKSPIKSRAGSRVTRAPPQTSDQANANNAIPFAPQVRGYKIPSKPLAGGLDVAPLQILQKFFSTAYSDNMLLHGIMARKSAQDNLIAFWRQPSLGLKDLLTGAISSVSPVFQPHEISKVSNLQQLDDQLGRETQSSTILSGYETRSVPQSMLSLILSASKVSANMKRAVAQRLGLRYPQRADVGTALKMHDRVAIGEGTFTQLHVGPTTLGDLDRTLSPGQYIAKEDQRIPKEIARNMWQRRKLEGAHRIGERPSSRKDDGETDAREHYLIKSIARLRQIYSQYAFNRIIRRPQNSSSTVVGSTAPSVSLISTSTVRTQSRNNKNNPARLGKLKDGSIDLPAISQLQVMFANRVIPQLASSEAISAVTLSLGKVLSSPVPPALLHRNTRSQYATLKDENKVLGFGGTNARGLDEPSPFRKGDFRKQDSRKDQSGSSRPEKSDKDLSLRDLRKKMEQIFQDELKRYGL
jgi:hypothetical protein